MWQGALEELLRSRAGCAAAACYLLVRGSYRRLSPQEAAAAAAKAGQQRWTEARPGGGQGGGGQGGGGQGGGVQGAQAEAAGEMQERAQLASYSGWGWGGLWDGLLRWLHVRPGEELERSRGPDGGREQGGGGGADGGGEDAPGAARGGEQAAAAWQALEEVPVLLAPPKDLELQDPQLAAGDFRQVGAGAGGSAAPWRCC